jgi:glc operon protein GlcG
MADTESRLALTHEGALRVLEAAMTRAAEMERPQCVSVVDAGGRLLAFVRMDGAKFLSIRTSQRKAMTAANRRTATGGIRPEHAIELALVSSGDVTNLKGGLPIEVDGQVIGAVGVSSGSGREDLEVAQAGVAAIPGARLEW